MSKTKLKDIVETYFKQYIEYKKVYDELYESNVKDTEAFLEDFIKNGGDYKEEDFRESAVRYYEFKPKYTPDLTYRMSKFLHAADLYIKVQEENDLSKEVTESYNRLKMSEYRPLFSVSKGRFKEHRDTNKDGIKYDDKFFKMFFESTKSFLNASNS